jgi:ferric-dicitrate binding protein FerR (iron transport regulator)
MNSDEKNGRNEASADRVAYLVAGYIRQTLSEQEHDELDAWITASDDNQRLFEELTDPATIRRGLHVMENVDADAARERIKSKISFTDKEIPRAKKRWMPYSTAAAIVVAAGLIVFFMVNRKTKPGKEIAKTNLIKPGGNYAVLTLTDGRTVNLSEVKNGLIDSTNGNEVLKPTDGQINYESHSNAVNEFHVLTTPAGGQYSVALPDGSRVWLNSLSSLRYAVNNIPGRTRVVELTGEGYFEVAHLTSPGLKATPSGGGEKKIPFIVMAKGVMVEVLGTHFNINAYSDEPTVSTTLLEGKVRVGSGKSSVNSRELNPGEQAMIDKQGMISVNKNIVADEVLAWKNGMFLFHDSPIEYVMRQVARWYDAEIVYEGKVDHHFNATIYRKEPLAKLLKLLGETDEVHFKVEGKKIIVKP